MPSKDDLSQRERFEAAADKALAKTADFPAAVEAAKLREQQFAEALDREAAERAEKARKEAVETRRWGGAETPAKPTSSFGTSRRTGPGGNPVVGDPRINQRALRREFAKWSEKGTVPDATWHIVHDTTASADEAAASPIPDAELRAPASKTPPDPLASRPGGRTTPQVASVTEEPTPPLSARERIEAAADKALASKAAKATK